jgi:hypothetical protein
LIRINANSAKQTTIKSHFSLDLHFLRRSLEIRELFQVLSNLGLLQKSEWLPNTNNPNLNRPRLDLSLFRGRLLQHRQRVQNHLLLSGVLEMLQVVLQVSSCRLRPCSNRLRLALKKILRNIRSSCHWDMSQTSGARPCRLLRPKARRRMVVWRPFGFCAGILVLWDGFTFSDFVDQSVEGLVGAVYQLVVEGRHFP